MVSIPVPEKEICCAQAGGFFAKGWNFSPNQTIGGVACCNCTLLWEVTGNHTAADPAASAGGGFLKVCPDYRKNRVI